MSVLVAHRRHRVERVQLAPAALHLHQPAALDADRRGRVLAAVAGEHDLLGDAALAEDAAAAAAVRLGVALEGEAAGALLAVAEALPVDCDGVELLAEVFLREVDEAVGGEVVLLLVLVVDDVDLGVAGVGLGAFDGVGCGLGQEACEKQENGSRNDLGKMNRHTQQNCSVSRQKWRA